MLLLLLRGSGLLRFRTVDVSRSRLPNVSVAFLFARCAAFEVGGSKYAWRAVGILVAEHLGLLTGLLWIHLREAAGFLGQLLPCQNLRLLKILLRDVQSRLIGCDLLKRLRCNRELLFGGLQEAGFLSEQHEGDRALRGADEEVGNLADPLVLLVDDRRVAQIAGEVNLLSASARLLDLLLDLLGELLRLLLSLLLLDAGLRHRLLQFLFDLLPLWPLSGELLGEALGFLLRLRLLNPRLRQRLLDMIFDLLLSLLLLLLRLLGLLLLSRLLLGLRLAALGRRCAEFLSRRLSSQFLKILLDVLSEFLGFLLGLLFFGTRLFQGVLDLLFDLFAFRLLLGELPSEALGLFLRLLLFGAGFGHRLLDLLFELLSALGGSLRGLAALRLLLLLLLDWLLLLLKLLLGSGFWRRAELDLAMNL